MGIRPEKPGPAPLVNDVAIATGNSVMKVLCHVRDKLLILLSAKYRFLISSLTRQNDNSS
jgi:hypothetical protein